MNILKKLLLFSDRENPDYANSIKEGTAVAAAAKELTGDDNATLNRAIQKLEDIGIR